MPVTHKRLIAGVLALIAGPAPAGDDRYTDVSAWIDIGDVLLGADERARLEAAFDDERFLVVGFEFRFDYGEPVEDDSWASDLQVIVEGPDERTYVVGGLSHLPESDENWSFSGPASDDPGHYGDNGIDIFVPWTEAPQASGRFQIDLRNDWINDPHLNSYECVAVRFYLRALDLCRGDLDGSGTVDFGDVLSLLVAWGPCEGCPEDLNRTGEVDFADVLLLFMQWGPCE